jgi:hypothetical protein
MESSFIASPSGSPSVAPITGTRPKPGKVADRKRVRIRMHRSTHRALKALARQHGVPTRRYIRSVLEAHVAAHTPSGGETLDPPTNLIIQGDAITQSPEAEPIVQP